MTAETGREVILAPSSTVAIAGTVEDIVANMREYQKLTEKLLVPADYQQIGAKQFKKKSAWRKYALAFNISDLVTFEDILRADDGYPIYARIRVKATHPSGRSAEADHECHITERCCPTIWGDPCPKVTWRNHTCCQVGCSGRKHFSHPGDIPATATTRAKNRAISDLIGAGEVSAEEMDGQRPVDDPLPPGATEGEFRDLGPVGDVRPPGQAAPIPVSSPEVTCKFCNGPCYDNRGDKRSESYPDFKCKNKDGCGGAGWLKDGALSWRK